MYKNYSPLYTHHKDIMRKFTTLFIFILASVNCFAQNPTAKNVFGNKLLQSIIISWYDGQEIDEWTFTYNDAGQVTKIDYIDEFGNTGLYAFDYNQGFINGETYHILMTYSDDEETIKSYLRLGSNNFVEYCYECTEEFGYGTFVTIWNFEYNSDGQVCKVSRCSDDDYTTESVATYTDGDIIDIKTISTYDSSTSTVSYTSSSVTFPIDNVDNIWGVGFDFDDFGLAYYAGLLGKSSKHLPVKLMEVDYEGSENYSWKFDGSKTYLTITDDEDDTFVETATYTWKNTSTDIVSTKVDDEKTVDKIYDSCGLLLNRQQRGINIINGKKIMVR